MPRPVPPAGPRPGSRSGSEAVTVESESLARTARVPRAAAAAAIALRGGRGGSPLAAGNLTRDAGPRRRRPPSQLLPGRARANPGPALPHWHYDDGGPGQSLAAPCRDRRPGQVTPSRSESLAVSGGPDSTVTAVTVFI